MEHGGEAGIDDLLASSGTTAGSEVLAPPRHEVLAEATRALAEANRVLAETQERSRRYAALTRTAIVLLRQGQVVESNPAAARLLGSESPEDLRGARLSDLVYADDAEAVASWLDELGPGQEHPDCLAVRLCKKSGAVVDTELLALALREGGESVVQLLAYDVTDRLAAERAETEMTYMSLHDELTGLPNRLLFVDRVRQALARASRSGDKVALMFCDLDRFTVVNDSLGHAMGDRVLVAAAQRLRSALRPGDTVARFGGDEFVLVCEVSKNPSDVAVVANRLLHVLDQPVELEGKSLSCGASIGVSIALSRLSDPDDLVRDAAAAASQAKARGRGRFEVFDEATRARAVGRMQMEALLRHALENDELLVYYQPLVACAGRRLVGMEALVRWRHPEHGFILPDSFIPVAEDSGLISALGDWVMREAFSQAASWEGVLPEGQAVELSVNLSANQLRDPGLVERVARAIPPGVAPAPGRQVHLAIEVTESTLVKEGSESIAVLEELHDLGLRIVIDDFGTGYSSLAYLKRFPAHSLKIDQSFVAGVDGRADDRAIVGAVVQLAHELGLGVIAEGVERESQLQVLVDMGCDVVQGFLFGRALPAPAMTGLLVAHESPVTLEPVGATHGSIT
ncbi:MAG: bifunctional diguanylate cyclase/phosphodiesterase [Actinomycetota bacterium]|nr:bifunctional diguanylate cyclase/phosphodiesterase [Actinomycetota bacterium]